MGTTNVDNAAKIASEQSGIPIDITKALILMEGPTQSAPNNPFDVTKYWAELAGFGGSVTGLFNSVGVANFSTELPAIQAWAYGLLKFTNYANLRNIMAKPTSTVQDFFNELGKTGYAGNDPGYAVNLGQLYQRTTNLDPTVTLLDHTTVQPIADPVADPKPNPAPVGAVATATAVPNAGILQPIVDITSAVAAIPKSIAEGIASLERFFWIAIGVVLVLAGIALLVQSSKQVQDTERTAAIAAIAA